MSSTALRQLTCHCAREKIAAIRTAATRRRRRSRYLRTERAVISDIALNCQSTFTSKLGCFCHTVENFYSNKTDRNNKKYCCKTYEKRFQLHAVLGSDICLHYNLTVRSYYAVTYWTLSLPLHTLSLSFLLHCHHSGREMYAGHDTCTLLHVTNALEEAGIYSFFQSCWSNHMRVYGYCNVCMCMCMCVCVLACSISKMWMLWVALCAIS